MPIPPQHRPLKPNRGAKALREFSNGGSQATGHFPLAKLSLMALQVLCLALQGTPNWKLGSNYLPVQAGLTGELYVYLPGF